MRICCNFFLHNTHIKTMIVVSVCPQRLLSLLNTAKSQHYQDPFNHSTVLCVCQYANRYCTHPCSVYINIYFNDVSSDSLNSRQKAVNTHTLSTLCKHADTKKTAARAQTEKTLQRQEVGPFFGGKFSPHLTSDEPRANCLLHHTHRPQHEPHIGATFCYSQRLSAPWIDAFKGVTSGCSKRSNAALSRSQRLHPK